VSSFARGVSAACQQRALDWHAIGRPACHLLAFLVPAVLATNYTISRFYTLGAPMWDAGWFAHLSCHGLQNPPAMGGTFLSDHMSFVLAVLALVHTISPAMPDPVFFAFTQGFWFGILGLGTSICVMPWLPARRGLLLATLCAMNGISLATLGFPHIEIAIPALIVMVLALWTTNRRMAALTVVPLLLTVREDAGLHLAIILALMAGYGWCRTSQWRAGRMAAALALLCVITSFATLAVQQAFFSDGAFAADGMDSLHAVYLGRPTLAHRFHQGRSERGLIIAARPAWSAWYDRSIAAGSGAFTTIGNVIWSKVGPSAALVTGDVRGVPRHAAGRPDDGV
jgi:hypothetical protein